MGSHRQLAVTAHTATDEQRLAPETADGSIDLVLRPFDAAADAALAKFMSE